MKHEAKPALAPERHHALVVPSANGYVVSCSCGWAGGSYEAPEPAELAAEGHEADPADLESEAEIG